MRHVAVTAALAVASCTGITPGTERPMTPAPAAVDLAPSSGPGDAPPIRPAVLDLTQTRPPAAPPPPSDARTVEEFDTTSAQQRADATAPPPAAGARRLGSTIGTLGPPTDPGIWVKTPLVSSVTPGRVETADGQSVNVELRPSGGAPGSGSQISLAAMRLLNVPLTSLPELVVYGF